MYFGLSQKCPKVALYDDALRSCEYCIHGLHDVYNFASSLHSTEHLNREACTQHICALPNQKPAEISTSNHCKRVHLHNCQIGAEK